MKTLIDPVNKMTIERKKLMIRTLTPIAKLTTKIEKMEN